MSRGNKDRNTHELTSAELIKSYVISLIIAIPCLLLTVYLIGFHADWPEAHMIFGVIMAVSVVNFVLIIVLDQLRAQTGSFTVPAMLATCVIIVLLVIVEGLSRFIPLFDFRWLYPVIAGVMIFKYLALFKERNLALKFYLAMNIAALAALGSLGADSKIALPF
jgi:heme/copper-type cytochrome/quinol oxidase subunit 4